MTELPPGWMAETLAKANATLDDLPEWLGGTGKTLAALRAKLAEVEKGLRDSWKAALERAIRAETRASGSSRSHGRSETVVDPIFQHSDDCDVNDPIIKTKPCNCWNGVIAALRAKLAEAENVIFGLTEERDAARRTFVAAEVKVAGAFKKVADAENRVATAMLLAFKRLDGCFCDDRGAAECAVCVAVREIWTVLSA